MRIYGFLLKNKISLEELNELFYSETDYMETEEFKLKLKIYLGDNNCPENELNTLVQKVKRKGVPRQEKITNDSINLKDFFKLIDKIIKKERAEKSKDIMRQLALQTADYQDLDKDSTLINLEYNTFLHKFYKACFLNESQKDKEIKEFSNRLILLVNKDNIINGNNILYLRQLQQIFGKKYYNTYLIKMLRCLIENQKSKITEN